MSPFNLSISRLAGLGDGSGVYDNQNYFVAKSAVGDVLKVRPTGKDRAEIVSIVTPGKDRVEAPCPHYASCGGCTLQHLNENAYHEFKKSAVALSVSYAGYPDAEMRFHSMPANSRRRVDFKVYGGKLAYVEGKSHNRISIETCLILTPALQALIAPLNALLPTLADTRSVRMTEADSGIDVQIEGSNFPDSTLRAFADRHNLARINTIMRRPVTMRFGGKDVTLPQDAFLQASKEAETLMISLVLEGVQGGKNIVEFFSGLGTYTFPLAAKTRVEAYELDAAMVSAMRQAEHPNIKAHKRDLFKQPVKANELSKFDTAIINPPRTGADAQTRELAARGMRTIVMVSCNHSTFSRDAKTLKNAGYKLESLDVIDQFVYSPHVELVSVFTKQG